MRILVFPNSHGDVASITKIMEKFYPDVAIHLGGGIEDLLNMAEDFPLTRLLYVRGDVDNSGDIYIKELFDNISIYMTHHEYQFTIKHDMDKISDI